MLAYHDVSDPAGFAQHLDYLLRHAHPVTLDAVLQSINGHRSLPKRAVLITFDDGDRSIIDVAMPMLKQRGLPAVAFIIAGLLDTDQPFWWVEVKELLRHGSTVDGFAKFGPDEIVRALCHVDDEQRLAVLNELRRTATRAVSPMPQLRHEELPKLESAGIAIGNHTLTHPCLSHCTDDKSRTEIVKAHEILAAALGHAPRAFAFPNGDADQRVAAPLTELGYEAAFLFDHWQSTNTPTDRFRISRVRVNSYTSIDRFRMIVSGLHPAVHHARGLS